MEKIVRKNGYVYLVQDWDKKGFETYYNLGKDPNDPRWFEDEEELVIIENDDIIEVVPKSKKTKKSED